MIQTEKGECTLTQDSINCKFTINFVPVIFIVMVQPRRNKPLANDHCRPFINENKANKFFVLCKKDINSVHD